jgi:hypothetical protein
MPGRLGRRIAAGHDRRPTSGTPQAEETQSRHVGEHLLPARRQRDRRIPGERDTGHPGVLHLAGLDQQRVAHGQRDGREQLVGDPDLRVRYCDALPDRSEVGRLRARRCRYPAVPLTNRALAEGHGNDSFAAMIEQFRKPAAARP